MRFTILVLFSCLTLTAVLYFWQQTPVTAAATQLRPSFKLPDLQNKLYSNSEWDGKIVVVNFWATWCPPCIEEIPLFIELQKKYRDQGLQFVGIAIDEADSVSRFIEMMGINYPILLEQKHGKTAQHFGNQWGALPFTAIVNRQGGVVHRQVGSISRAELLDILRPLLSRK